MPVPAFLQTILSFFGGKNNNPETGKKRAARAIGKKIRASQFGNFYKVRTKEVQILCAEFFYAVYKTIALAQIHLRDVEKSAGLKRLILESFLGTHFQEFEDRFSEEAIAERSREIPSGNLAAQLWGEFQGMADSFDRATIGSIDACYNLILCFARFAAYDYFSLMKKFGAGTQEYNFSTPPIFTVTKGEYLSGGIKDFLDAALLINPEQDWKDLFKLLRLYTNVNIMDLEQWNGLLLQIQSVLDSNILPLMVQHIDGDPGYAPGPQKPREHIFSFWLESKRVKTEELIEKITKAKWKVQIAEMAQPIFGAGGVNGTKYYTEKAGEAYVQNGFDGFTHAEGLNYLLGFLQGYFVPEVRELCDLLMIRAQWSASAMSMPLSSEVHSVTDLMNRLVAFDISFRNDGSYGARLVNALVKADREKSQARIIREILSVVNEDAQQILIQISQSLVVVGRSLKSAADDYFQTPHQLIINWRELELAAIKPLNQWLPEASAKLAQFAQMMQLFVQAFGVVL